MLKLLRSSAQRATFARRSFSDTAKPDLSHDFRHTDVIQKNYHWFYKRFLTNREETETMLESDLNATQRILESRGEGVARTVYMTNRATRNSLSLKVARDLNKYFTAYNMNDTDMIAWFLRSTDYKFFCPGADLRYMLKSSNLIKDNENRTYYMQQLFSEYQGLAYKSTRLGRPFIPYVNGIIGDAGIALALHARYCVVGPEAVLGFSQTERGWLPDAGATYILPRLESPGLGMFLALSGYKLQGYDLVKAGVVDQFLDVGSVDGLWQSALHTLDPAGFNSVFNDVVSTSAQQLEDDWIFTLADKQEVIAECFDRDSVEEILEALQDKGEWGASLIRHIRSACPTSVKLTHRLIRQAEQMSLKECLVLEHRCQLNLMARADFREGLEKVAHVGDGSTPSFYPAALEEVDDATLADLMAKPKAFEDLNLDLYEPIIPAHDLVDVQPFDHSQFSNRTSRAQGHTRPEYRDVKKWKVNV